MSEYEQQIDDLLRAGKITAEEAAQLRGDEGDREAIAPLVAPADAPVRLAVKLFGGDVRVRGVPGLERPALSGGHERLEVVPTRDGWRVVPRGMGAAPGMLGLLVRGLRSLAHQRVELEVPVGVERVDVDLVTGDVEVDGVEGHVAVRTQSGKVELERTGPFDVSTKLGDVRVRARLDRGTSRVSVVSGDVDLKLLEGSSVRIAASVITGDAHGRRVDLAPVDNLVGGRWRGRVGEGDAELSVSITSGDLDVLVEGGR